MRRIFIGICGNIGSGKTTLSNFLSRKGGALEKFGKVKVFREDVTKNPYLKMYYENPKRWAFESQMSFLAQRLVQHQELEKFVGVAISDRTIYEDGQIFARSLHDQNILSDLAFKNYKFWFDFVVKKFKIPDLLLYLKIEKIDTLIKRIQIRGREYEKSITYEYLNNLNEKYNNWVNKWNGKKIIINAEIDMNKKKDYLNKIEKIIIEKITK